MFVFPNSVSQRLFRRCVYIHDTGYLLLATKPDSNQEKDKDFMPYCSQLMSDSGCELAYCWGQDMCRKRPLFASFTQRRVMGKGSKQRQRSLFILDLPFSWKASLFRQWSEPCVKWRRKSKQRSYSSALLSVHGRIWAPGSGGIISDQSMTASLELWDT